MYESIRSSRTEYEGERAQTAISPVVVEVGVEVEVEVGVEVEVEVVVEVEVEVEVEVVVGVEVEVVVGVEVEVEVVVGESMSLQIPILFLGDAPSMNTGLARIGRDLATQVSRMPEFRVAYLGRGLGAHTGLGIADSRLPFFQYTYQPTGEDQWGMRVLPDVWRNWADGAKSGVIMTLWDLSRLMWFGNPQPMGDEFAALYDMLVGDPSYPPFERWGYFAVDAEGPGPNGALAPMLADALAGFDRVLAYSKFGKRVLDATSRTRTCDWLPHGYVESAFQPRDHAEARRRFGQSLAAVDDHQPLIGCVMTNQARKDWGLWARAMRLVVDARPDTVLWAHTDTLSGHWDLRLLLDAYGLLPSAVVTTDSPTDVEMSWRYSACDLTVLPSLGEGFGYPIVESQACGVPVVHGSYAAGAELLAEPDMTAVNPRMMTLDTRFAMVKPVYEPTDWADTALQELNRVPNSSAFAGRVKHLDWRRLWPGAWEKWFREGAQRLMARGPQ